MRSDRRCRPAPPSVAPAARKDACSRKGSIGRGSAQPATQPRRRRRVKRERQVELIEVLLHGPRPGRDRVVPEEAGDLAPRLRGPERRPRLDRSRHRRHPAAHRRPTLLQERPRARSRRAVLEPGKGRLLPGGGSVVRNVDIGGGKNAPSMPYPPSEGCRNGTRAQACLRTQEASASEVGSQVLQPKRNPLGPRPRLRPNTKSSPASRPVPDAPFGIPGADSRRGLPGHRR